MIAAPDAVHLLGPVPEVRFPLAGTPRFRGVPPFPLFILMPHPRNIGAALNEECRVRDKHHESRHEAKHLNALENSLRWANFAVSALPAKYGHDIRSLPIGDDFPGAHPER